MLYKAILAVYSTHVHVHVLYMATCMCMHDECKCGAITHYMYLCGLMFFSNTSLPIKSVGLSRSTDNI